MICIFLFYKGKFWKFSTCSLMLFARDGAYMFEPRRSWMLFKKLKEMSLEDYISKIESTTTAQSMLVVKVNGKPKRRYTSMLSKTCNEILKHIAGIDLGLNFTPYQFYKALLKHDTKQNYEILYSWNKQ